MRPHERPETKVCRLCQQTKVADEFSVGRRQCKQCRSEIEARRYRQPEYNARHAVNRARYYKEKRETILAQKSEYGMRPDIAERDKARRRERYETEEAFRLKVKRRRDRYYAAKPHVFRARDAKRRANQLRATPSWADASAMREFYRKSTELTNTTGIKHEVDHIVPLQGRNVCGLHVETNLRVIESTINRRKFNKVQDIV